MFLDFSKFIAFVQQSRSTFKSHSLFGPLIFAIVAIPLLIPPFGGASFDVIKLGVWFFAVGLGLWGFTKTGLIWPRRVLSAWSLTWLAWVVLVSLISRDSLAAFWGGYPRYNQSVAIFILFIGTIWAVSVLGSKYRSAIQTALVGTGVCMALFAILQSFGVGYYGGIQSFFASIPDRVPSTLGNPNFSSWWVAVTLPFILFRTFEAHSFRRRLLSGLYLLVAVWGLALFSSRGALLAVLASSFLLLAYLGLTRRWKDMVALCVLALLSVGIFSGYYYLYRPSALQQFTTLQDNSATDRYTAWGMAAQVLREHPLVGVGPANFEQYYWEHLPSSLMGGGKYFDDPHNVFLLIGVALGWPGLLLFLALLGLIAVEVLRKRASLGDSKVLALCALVAWLCAGQFNPVAVALWFELAVILGLFFAQDSKAEVLSAGGKLSLWALRGVAVLCCILGVGLVVNEYSSVYAVALNNFDRRPAALHESERLLALSEYLLPFTPEARNARTSMLINSNKNFTYSRLRIDSAFSLHPWSVRGALLAAQLSAQLWGKSHENIDLARTERYSAIAQGGSTGFLGIQSWRAYFLYASGRPDQALIMARYASLQQPDYFYNWLLLAKLDRDRGSLHSLLYDLSKAQRIAPDDKQVARLWAHVKLTQDPKSVDFVPVDPQTLARFR